MAHGGSTGIRAQLEYVNLCSLMVQVIDQIVRHLWSDIRQLSIGESIMILQMRCLLSEEHAARVTRLVIVFRVLLRHLVVDAATHDVIDV